MSTNPNSGAGAGTGNNSSCYDCHVSVSFIDHVSKMSDEFERDATEFEVDAKCKSDIFISKLRRSLLSILLETSKTKVDNSNMYLSLSTPENLAANENNDNSTDFEDGNGQDYFLEHGEPNSNTNANSKPKTKPLKRLKMLQERAKENDRVNKAIRVQRIETPGNSTIFYECLICERQFNNSGNARRHVKVLHFNLGALCPQPYCKKRFFNKLVMQSHVSKCNKTTKPNSIKKMNPKEPTIVKTEENVVDSIDHTVIQYSARKEKAKASNSLNSIPSTSSSSSQSQPRKKKIRSRRLTMDTRLGDYTLGEAMAAKIMLTPLKIINMDPYFPDGDFSNNMEEIETPDQTFTNRMKEETE